ncbi:glycosyltransferase [Patescibacteria group bacterium]|nr:glycosyltransferase [Patescibacteria group bacterium]
MKIAIIFPKDSEAIFNTGSTRTFGGATVQMYLFAKELNNYKNKGINTYSFIVDYKKIYFKDFNSFNFIKTYKEKDFFIIKYFKFLRQLLAVKPDIVIQHGLTIFSCILAVICEFLGIKFVFMFANDRESEGYYQVSNKKCPLFWSLLASSHFLIVQNDFQLKQIPEKFKNKSEIIKNGFEIGEFNNEIRNYVLWVARHDHFKRPSIFLDIVKMNPAINFIMICPPTSNDSHYDSFENSANEIQNLKFISFISFNEIDNYFKKAKIFVNTSESEGFPQTFIQAAMHSVPILSLSVNPTNFLSTFNCGFSFNDNVKKLSDKISELFKNDIEYVKLSKNIYEYALNNHNIKDVTKKLLNYLNYEYSTDN